ncbi:T6SS effector BTH_I2691 family protein [Vibrio scophthalmi]|uniref:T6SS effector BTH_I2691 family protein n=1 Tax=Vibrio scophthalmi TaxID=45658 RepID=UPI003873CB67
MSDENASASQQPSTEVGSIAGQCPMQAMGIDIIPVRYAIDESLEDGSGRFGLPEKWQGNGIFADDLTRSNYTLRQLRDGWLYVISDHDKTFHEYEVCGTQLKKYNLDRWEKEQGKTERGEAGENKPFLTYNQENTLYIAWSKQRWTWRLFNYVLTNKSKCKQWMRKVDLSKHCQTLNEPHMGLATDIVEAVSDISHADSSEAYFTGTSVPTSLAEGGDAANTEVKPIAQYGAITNGIKKDAAIFVALDDPLVDLQDLSLILGEKVLDHADLQEKNSHKWALLETAAQVTALSQPEDLNYPDTVKTEEEKQLYYQDLTPYMEHKRQVENALKQGGNFGAGRGYIADQQAEMAKNVLFDKYGKHNIDNAALLERWSATQKWRNEVDAKKIYQAIDDFNANEKPVLEALVDTLNIFRDQLVAATQRFGWEPEKGFVDIEEQQGQDYLSEVHFFINEVVTKVLDEKTTAWIEKEFESPTTLLPLYLSGYSKALYEKIGDELIPAESDYVSFNDTGNFTSRINEMNAFLGTEEVQDSRIYAALSESLQRVMNVFQASISEMVDGGVSIIARKSAALAVMFPKMHFIDRATVVERIAIDKKITLQEDFLNQRRNWMAERQRVAKELNQAYHEFNANKLASHLDIVGYDSQSAKQNIAAQSDALEREIDDLSQKQQSFDELHQAEAEYKNNATPETAARYQKALNQMGELYYAMPSMYLLAEQDIANEFRTNIKQQMARGLKITANTYNSLGGLGFMVFLLNAKDLYTGYGDLQKNSVTTSREKAELAQKFFYTLNALGSIFQAKAWAKVDKGTTKFLKQSIQDASTQQAGRVAKFVNLTRVTATLGVIAVGIELFYVLDDYSKAESKEEKFWLGVKAASLFGMGTTFILQRAAIALGSRLAMSVLLAIASPVVALIIGGVYLISSLVLNSLKKDDYQKWLSRLPWSADNDSTKFTDTPEGVAEALLALYQFTMQPKLSAQLMVERVENKISSYPAAIATTTGFKLIVDLPGTLNQVGNIVKVGINSPCTNLKPATVVWSQVGDALRYEHNQTLNKKTSLAFDIEVSFYMQPEKSSHLHRKITYHYTFSGGQLSDIQLTPIQPLTADEVNTKSKTQVYDPSYYTDRKAIWAGADTRWSNYALLI